MKVSTPFTIDTEFRNSGMGDSEKNKTNQNQKKKTNTKLVGKRFQLILFSGEIITIHRPSFIGIVSRGDPMQESAQERFLTREVQPLTRLYAIRDLTIRQRRRP